MPKRVVKLATRVLSVRIPAGDSADRFDDSCKLLDWLGNELFDSVLVFQPNTTCQTLELVELREAVEIRVGPMAARTGWHELTFRNLFLASSHFD